jgi:hypothetical protein
VTQIHKAEWNDPDNLHTGPQGLVEAYIVQTGDDNAATQVQGPDNKLGDAYMITDQSGNGNIAEQEQNSYSNEAFINQTGIQGVAKQYQDRGLPVGYIEATSNLAVIDQGGERNDAYQIQNGHANDAYSFQTGVGNYSHQVQGNDAATSWVSFAVVAQSGNYSDAEQTQLGEVNYGVINQSSNHSYAMQHQENTGDGVNPYHVSNSAHITQQGGDRNIAEQTQVIEFDPTPAEMGSTLPAMYPNVGHIFQNGSNNEAYQTQTGGHNIGLVSQTGNGNIANVTQSQSIITP